MGWDVDRGDSFRRLFGEFNQAESKRMFQEQKTNKMWHGKGFAGLPTFGQLRDSVKMWEWWDEAEPSPSACSQLVLWYCGRKSVG